MLDASIVTGPVRVLLLLIGPVALLALLAGRRPGWWTRRVPLAVAAGVAAAGLLVLVVQVLWQPFPDPLPRPAVLFTALTVMALVLALARGAGPARTTLALIGVLLVAVSGAAQVNQQFQAYPTLRGVLHLPLPLQRPFTEVATRQSTLVAAAPGQPLASVWNPPTDLPARGAVTTATIPGSLSGFHARPAWIYLPPAYLSTPRPLLPVLVLLAGQPGTPRDWFDGGQLNLILDQYAAAHHGLAPVVVVPDPLGSQLANPLCVDSPAGNAFTYLTHDVPTWIQDNLQVDPAPTGWAIGGVSAGATCALQLAVRVPQTFPTSLILSAQVEPTLGSRSRTLRDRFANSLAAFQAANPLDILHRTRLPHSAALVAVGAQDALYRPQADQLAAGLSAADVQVRRAQAPGGHSWVVWRAVLRAEMPWLSQRLNLT